MILVLDTATRRPVVALAADDGTLLVERTWESRQRHGEELLTQLDAALAEIGARRDELTAAAVGTGPGSFTGLRIGMATAKTIAYALAIPIVGISSTRALALAAHTANPDAAKIAVSLPAGAADRYVHQFKVSDGLPVEAKPAALAAGAAKPNEIDGEEVSGLAAALARLGAAALAAGEADDPQTLVPAYVALPRGIAAATQEMKWSPDLR